MSWNTFRECIVNVLTTGISRYHTKRRLFRGRSLQLRFVDINDDKRLRVDRSLTTVC